MERLLAWLTGGSHLAEPLIWLQRRETWYADFKTNYLRLLALALFTLGELIAYSGFHAINRRFHVAALLILLIWWTAATLFQGAVSRHFLPRLMPYAMATVDLLLLTALLVLGEGAQSSLVAIYFLIVALSSIRLDPLLVLYSAAGACVCYAVMFVLSWGEWSLLTQTTLHGTVIPLCLVLMGLIMSRWIRRVLLILDEMLKEGKTP